MTLAGLLPPDFGPLLSGLLVLVSFGTSLITAAFGIGGGAVLLALLAALMPPAALIPVHGAVQFGSNVFRAALMAATSGAPWCRCSPSEPPRGLPLAGSSPSTSPPH